MTSGPFVFAYGSLLRDASGIPCTLHGWRRSWGVAMDNRRTLPGYRYFLDSRGRRPEVYVAFLDVVPCAGGRVDGMVFPAADLAALDARERNYARVDVSGAVDHPGPVFAYAGLPEARARRRAGEAVVWATYVERVRAGFAAHGVDFDGTTEPHGLPVWELTEVRVPG
jgi:cation transport regulator ChaC